MSPNLKKPSVLESWLPPDQRQIGRTAKIINQDAHHRSRLEGNETATSLQGLLRSLEEANNA